MAEHDDVFLSSTSIDLGDYRTAAVDIILSMDLHPIGMESFQPTVDNPVEKCYREVLDAEFFVGIYAYRYGYMPPAGMPYPDGLTDGTKGITHLEYEWARARPIPMMLFVADEAWQGQKDEDLTRIEAFRAHILANHVVGFFSNPDDLRAKLAPALYEAIGKVIHNYPGWNRPEPEPPPEHFAGRAAEINTIQAMLHGKSGAHVVVQGIGGAGKTALAKFMAKRLGRDYPGGALWAELGPSMTEPGSVQTFTFERWKNVTPEGLDADSAQIEAQHIRAFLMKSPGPLLAVIDDVWEARSIKPLLDVLPPGTNLIITTRDAGVHPSGRRFELTELLPEDALDFFKGRLGLTDDTHDAQLNQIAHLLGYHALAIDIAAAKLQMDSIDDADKLIDRLQRHRDGDNPFAELNLGEGRDVNLEAALALSYLPLDDTHKRYFRLLGTLPPGLDFAREMALAVWGIDMEDEAAVEAAENALDHITRVALAGRLRGRYLLHNNLTYYARALMRREPTDEETPARQRFQGAMIAIARQFVDLQPEKWLEHISPDYELIAYHADEFVSEIEKWLAANHLPSLEAHAQPEPLPKPATDEAAQKLIQNTLDFLYAGVSEYVWRRHLGTEGRAWHHAGLLAARIVEHHRAEGYFMAHLGIWHNNRGYKQAATGYYEAKLPIDRELGDRSGEATTLNNIGSVYWSTGDQQQALDFYQQALPLRREVGDRSGEATTLNNIGLVYWSTGDNQQALDFYQQALPILREVGDRSGKATTLNNISSVYFSLGDNTKALEYLQQSIPLYVAVGDRGGQALTNFNMSFLVDSTAEAIQLVEQARDLWRAVQSPNVQDAEERLQELRGA